MNLNDLAFAVNERAEAQHQLKRIPQNTRVDHPELKTALKQYEQARADEHETRLAHVQAEQELPAAQYRDEQALAASKSAKKPDKGPVEEEKQLALIRETRRQHGAAKILLESAVSKVVEAFSEHGVEYEESLLTHRDELRDVLSDLLAGVEKVWGELQTVVANLAIGTGSQAPVSAYVTGMKISRILDGDVIQIVDVLQGLRDLAKPVEGEERPQRLTAQEKVTAWARSDEQEGRARGAGLSDERKAERAARADAVRARREAALAEADAELAVS